MKKIFAVLFSVLIVVSIFSACGKTKSGGSGDDSDKVYTEGDYDYTILEDGTAKIIGFHNTKNYDELSIPAKFENDSDDTSSTETETEAAVSNEASESTETVKEDNGIPVTVIGEGAFENVTGIEYVKFSKNLVEIEKRAFAGSSIKNAIMVSSRKLTKIGEEAFADCKSLVQIDIPSSVVDFGARCFANATSLVVISFRGNQENIDNSIFEGSSSFRICTYEKNNNIKDFAKANDYELKIIG